MRRLTRALGALALTLAAAGGVALAPADAAAQGKGRKSFQDNGKEYRKAVKRQARAERRYERRLDRRGRDDRRWDDRRDHRWDGRRVYETRRRPVRTYNAGASRVPPGHLPPPGLCRIWIDGVPPGRQPRPTSCGYAERYRPANARVIYGDRARRDDRDYGRVYDRDGRVYDSRDRRDGPVVREPRLPIPRAPLPPSWP
ncbi:hypothetical protein [Roseisolibacter sp. H3M3-2]|uniref:hypothetical protein n=1 Tax=Roseisolibacter sp. H3M3-2 TaxID=3031323 RepID=UPI0023DB4F2D|nr:hypothetical protein [Roseisolibacter sp. H3M3-2]MDF1502848.1 hypothetical protein [Roseisolibacter sp. H3M3-2]